MNTQQYHSMQEEQVNSTPPAKDLIKLTGIAACAFILYFFIGFNIFLSTDQSSIDDLLGAGAGLRLSILFVLFTLPVIFSQLFPWMESYGLNSFSGKNNVIWALLTTLFLFILVVVLVYISSHLFYSDSGNLLQSQTRYDSINSGFGVMLVEFLKNLFFMAIFYAVLWSAFTLTKKLRGYHAPTDPSIEAQERAGSVTKWSFVLAQSVGATTAFMMIGLIAYFISNLFGYRSSFSLADSSSLFWIICFYLLILFIIMPLIYAFTEKHLPKEMQKVEPHKLFLSYALIYIFCTLIAVGLTLLGECLQHFSRGGLGLGIVLLIFITIAAVLMCKKLLCDMIQIPWVRVLTALLIFIPTLFISVVGSRVSMAFLINFLIAFSVIVFVLFIMGQTIKWALRIVYGPPKAIEL